MQEKIVEDKWETDRNILETRIKLDLVFCVSVSTDATTCHFGDIDRNQGRNSRQDLVLPMTNDRKNLLVAICFVVFAVIMAGLTWFLRYMGLEFVLGFVCGAMLVAGCLFIISKDLRNLS
ncbi:MAG: hypothetical protein KGI75_04175 [Rhizobiaceae bacterium]|nr:hypothetical protein [Rhizobiaceae bacterium]